MYMYICQIQHVKREVLLARADWLARGSLYNYIHPRAGSGAPKCTISLHIIAYVEYHVHNPIDVINVVRS